RAALRRRLRICRRRLARAVSEGSDLAFLAVHLPQRAAPRLAHGPLAGNGLAGRAAARPGRARAARPGARIPVERASSALRAGAQPALVVAPPRGAVRVGAVRRDPDQDLE